MRPVVVLSAVATCAACARSSDARRAGQVRYEGRTLEAWWALRRAPDGTDAADARTAIRMLGPAAVPFLAAKAAGRDLGDVIGGSEALEGMCPNAVPAMEAARADSPSPALEAAIRRVRAEAADRVRAGECTANGAPARPDSADQGS